MEYAFIENGICINVAKFESETAVEEMKLAYTNYNIVPIENGFWIGDLYSDGVWTKAEPSIKTDAQQIAELEAVIDVMLNGGEPV